MASEVSLRALSRQFQMKLIENELDAALIFLGVAKNFLTGGKALESNDALAKAEAIYARASELARGELEAVPVLNKRLHDVKLTIEELRNSRALPAND